jgi:CRP-like cAMP-binding protein
MADKSRFWYLNHFNLFEGMDDDALQEVGRISSMTEMRPHQPIYFPDEPSHAIFFLKKGHVKISRIHPDGKEVILEVVGPGEVFGELSLVEEDAHRNELAETLDDALICAVKKEDFEDIMRRNPDLTLKITKRIGLRLRRFEERVTNLVFKDVKKRIAWFLTEYAEDFGKMKGDVITVRMHLSHQEIGLLTGCARQTVTTLLNEFRNAGLIDFSREGFTIKQYAAPQKMAS